MAPQFQKLNKSLIEVVDQYSMVSFLPHDLRKESSIQYTLSQIDNCIQYGKNAMLMQRRSQTTFDASLHNVLSSLAHASTHLQDPLLAVLKAKISPVEEMVGDNPPIDNSEAPAEIIPEDVLLHYFGSVDITPAPSSHVSIH
ncbi:hypothetical protein RND71_005702 [Anisodus tanguticus]|uniref:Uncharacterized protein n=1 Tax=Anisodus tanguticus TaxID=243964 RepID=A0AAE1VVP6_9SOLA|nr:hypothetical protein RND71_005702 [Anisodus tanguticus]